MLGGGNSIGGGQSKMRGKYPTEDRTCTDIICCLIFLIFWGVSTWGVIYGYSNGNLENIAQPYDDTGNACGVDKILKWNYLFVTSPDNLDLKKRHNVCTTGCPKGESEKIDCYTNSNVTDCSTLKSYATTAVSEYCIPDISKYMEGFNEKMKGLGAETVIQDISNSWVLFLICMAAAFFISLIYCFLLEYCAGLIITVLIIALFAGLATLGYFFKEEYEEIHSGQRPSSDSENFYYYLWIICWVLAGVLVCMVCCLWSRIVLAVQIIQATADFITDYQTVMLVPVFSVILFLGYITYWIWGGLNIFSVGWTEFVPGRAYGKMRWTNETKIFWYIHVFALFWNIAFITYLSYFVLSYITVSWYFSIDKYDIGSPFTIGYCLGLTKHVGSIAFGSLILAVIWSVQAVLAYIQQKMEESGAADNALIKCFIKIAMCLVECFKRLIKFISKHAFTEIAMRSTNFCGGAATSMGLIVSNMARMGILHGICELCISFGTIAITALTVLIGYLLLRYVEYFDNQVTQLASPLVIVFIIGYTVSQLFGHVFDVCSDAMIHCYLTEENESGNAGLHSEKLNKVIEEAREKNGHLLDNEPAPGYKVKQTDARKANFDEYR